MARTENFKRHLSNFFGWSTPRKLLVIESDDWGSIRMPSLEAFNRLSKKGLNLSSGDAMRYNRNDTLANVDDLSALFETLQGLKDGHGNSAVFTAVSLVANPDFDKIRENKFEKYFYEPFTATLEKYYGNRAAFDLWLQGMENQLFVPQFHGREHLNVAVWMKALQENDSETHLAFNEGLWGFNKKHPHGISYQAAFDLSDPAELAGQHQVIREGIELFEKLFNYRPSFFVPPNGPFNNDLERTAADAGIKFMSTSKIQQEPLGNGNVRKKLHYLGQKNRHQQIYLTRNCFFEPSHQGKDWVNSCLKEIEIAFRWKKPAVISSHRVNYIGALTEANRANGLTQLETLLRNVLIKWPNVEFITSDMLGKLIVKK